MSEKPSRFEGPLSLCANEALSTRSTPSSWVTRSQGARDLAVLAAHTTTLHSLPFLSAANSACGASLSATSTTQPSAASCVAAALSPWPHTNMTLRLSSATRGTAPPSRVAYTITSLPNRAHSVTYLSGTE
eukprot:Mycagemm_TRINITY_DN8364_c0_g1::TRINITY_DN8364_c0_g1_i2::g.5531::m.5531 type:complete len:131 gc:universal TRINITY_DN8364_c0_g1_i2:1503-1111(-)